MHINKLVLYLSEAQVKFVKAKLEAAINIFIEVIGMSRLVVAQRHKVCLQNRLVVGSPLEKSQYLYTFIISFLPSCVEPKRGVEFRHSTHNASRCIKHFQNNIHHFLLNNMH